MTGRTLGMIRRDIQKNIKDKRKSIIISGRFEIPKRHIKKSENIKKEKNFCEDSEKPAPGGLTRLHSYHTLAEKFSTMVDSITGRMSVQRYVDILSDAGFKAVFGDQRNKDVLIDLLNFILPENRKVRDLSYSSTEIPGFSLGSKAVRLDLRCTGDDGAVFIVEVQCYRQSHFFRRCVEYAAKVYDSGSARGDGHRYDIPPVFFICLLGDGADRFVRNDHSWDDRFISEYTFREKISHDVPDDTIFCIFVELNRFRKELRDCGTFVEQWCYALKRVGTLDSLPEELRTDVFERLFRACEIAKFDRDTKLIYEKDMITERDYQNIIDTAAEDGRAEGFAEGEAKGRSEGKAEGLAEGKAEERVLIAKALKKQGIQTSTIAAATGLSEEEVNAL